MPETCRTSKEEEMNSSYRDVLPYWCMSHLDQLLSDIITFITNHYPVATAVELARTPTHARTLKSSLIFDESGQRYNCLNVVQQGNS